MATRALATTAVLLAALAWSGSARGQEEDWPPPAETEEETAPEAPAPAGDGPSEAPAGDGPSEAPAGDGPSEGAPAPGAAPAPDAAASDDVGGVPAAAPATQPGAVPIGDGDALRYPWPRDGRAMLRFVYSHMSIPLDAVDVRGTAPPTGTRPAERRLEYCVEHTSARVEAAWGSSLADGVDLTLSGGLGWGSTELTLVSDPPNVLSGPGPNLDLTLDSSADFNLSLGANLRFLLGRYFFAGFDYRLLYGHAVFEDELFYAVVEGEYDYLRHDIMGRFGATNGFLSGWVGIGFLVYYGEADLDQQGGPNRWDLEVAQENVLVGSLGAAVHPNDHLVASLEFTFVPDPNIELAFGWVF